MTKDDEDCTVPSLVDTVLVITTLWGPRKDGHRLHSSHPVTNGQKPGG